MAFCMPMPNCATLRNTWALQFMMRRPPGAPSMTLQLGQNVLSQELQVLHLIKHRV